MSRPRRSNESQIKRDVLVGLTLGTPLTIVARANNVSDRRVRQWAEEDPDGFGEDLAAARALGWDALAHECLQIADDGTNDYVAIYARNNADQEGIIGWRLNGEAIRRSEVRINTRLRLLKVWDSGTYGEAPKQVRVDASLQATSVVRHTIDPALLDEAGRAALRALLAQAEAAGLLPPPEDADAIDAEYEEGGFARAGDRQRPDDSDTDT